MRVNADQLRTLIETLWRAEAPARYKLPPIDIEADSSNEAGSKASWEFAEKHGARGIDPFTISVEEKGAEKRGSQDNTLVASTLNAVRSRAYDVAQGGMRPYETGYEAGMEIFGDNPGAFTQLSAFQDYTTSSLTSIEQELGDVGVTLGAQADFVEGLFDAIAAAVGGW